MTRLFLACTPRTGNTWLRKLLAKATGGRDAAAHSPGEIAWEGLEPPCVVAMHWHCTPEFRAFLADRGFDVVVTVRHPLDVLISILHFSPHEPATARWLEGEGGDESSLRGADPTSSVFLDYALSRRASLLLGVSAEWRPFAREVVYYERLVEAPLRTLSRCLRQLGCETPREEALEEIVRDHALERMRRFSAGHFWRGEPGLWRRVIPTDYQRRIHERHREVFELWGYQPPDGPALPPDQARENWNAICEEVPAISVPVQT